MSNTLTLALLSDTEAAVVAVPALVLAVAAIRSIIREEARRAR